MELADNEKSKKLLKLLEQKRKIIERKRKVEQEIHIEQDRIRAKLGKMTIAKRKNYQTMKQAYHMRQEGSTFLEIGKKLDISASQASKLCQRYSILMQALEERDKN